MVLRKANFPLHFEFSPRAAVNKSPQAAHPRALTNFKVQLTLCALMLRDM